MNILGAWKEAAVQFLPKRMEILWQHRPDLSRVQSKISYATCLKVAESFETGRFSVFVNPGDEAIWNQANALCKKKKWQLIEAEYLGLDLSIVDLERPYVLEFVAEFENQSISRETVRSRGDFLRSDKSGLRDFVKLMSIPSRNRVYIGRTMRHGKKTRVSASEIQEEFRRYADSSVLAKRAVWESDKLEVLLVFMRERKISWPDDCAVGVGTWNTVLNEFQWNEEKPFSNSFGNAEKIGA